MKSPLGLVSVAAVTVVKVACVVGAAVAGYYLAGAALQMIVGNGTAAVYTDATRYGLGFLAGLAGFELAKWAGGTLTVIDAKEQQQAMLRKLESQHGVTL